MTSGQAARSEQPRAYDDLASQSAVLPARIRWGVYLLLIAIAVGNMTGRLLSVNSVDKVQLEAMRIHDRIESARQRLIKDGVSGDALDARMAIEESRLRNELKLQRPFLSANDRARWMT